MGAIEPLEDIAGTTTPSCPDLVGQGGQGPPRKTRGSEHSSGLAVQKLEGHSATKEANQGQRLQVSGQVVAKAKERAPQVGNQVRGARSAMGGTMATDLARV